MHTNPKHPRFFTIEQSASESKNGCLYRRGGKEARQKESEDQRTSKEASAAGEISLVIALYSSNVKANVYS